METNAPRVAVLADDLIWASRLVAAVQRCGATAAPARSRADLERLLAAPADAESPPVLAAVVVDLNGRSYDGVEAVGLAARAGRPVLAVGQHEDLALRKHALAAGADRVYSYNKLFRDGPAIIRALLDRTAAARAGATQREPSARDAAG